MKSLLYFIMLATILSSCSLFKKEEAEITTELMPCESAMIDNNVCIPVSPKCN